MHEATMERPTGGGKLVNERTAAAMLAMSPGTLRVWRCTGKGPAYLKIGGAVRYRIAALEEFAGAALEIPTPTPAGAEKAAGDVD